MKIDVIMNNNSGIINIEKSVNNGNSLSNNIVHSIYEKDDLYIKELEKSKSVIQTLVTSIKIFKFLYNNSSNQLRSEIENPEKENIRQIIERIFELFELVKSSVQILKKSHQDKNNTIEEIKNVNVVLSKICNKKADIIPKINSCIFKLKKKLYYKKIGTTEKNIIQNALLIGNTKNEEINNNLYRIINYDGNSEKTYKFDNSFIFPLSNKISKSYLYVNKTLPSCSEPILSPQPNDFLQYSLIKLKYPEEENLRKKSSNNDIKIKFVETSLVNIKDDDILKQPSFCNGIEYSMKNISNMASLRNFLQNKFKRNFNIYSNEDICNILNLNYNEDGIIIYESMIISAVSYSNLYLQSGIVSEKYDPIIVLDESKFDSDLIENKKKYLRERNLNEDIVIREEINLIVKNNDNQSDFQPIEYNPNGETSRAGTDGSYYQTSLYHRNSVTVNIEDEDGI